MEVTWRLIGFAGYICVFDETVTDEDKSCLKRLLVLEQPIFIDVKFSV